MMRIDKVINFLQKNQKKYVAGVSANELAIELNIHRSDASADLNKLFKLNIVSKIGMRPVRYQFVSENVSFVQDTAESIEDGFTGIVGHDGSIRAQIELAKAAVVYPPHGLHTLIFGESGSGKNLLAESMWNYAKTCWKKEKQEDIPFVQFCCADYAANEQLLLAQLFGYVKGAFTGANEEHTGMVDRAQGGILFLDEIHRLPPAGQELLFMLIDKGRYRRLGEVNGNRTANLMIIGATSEDVSSSLLMTFRRRIPVQIGLPRINERPIYERINIIMHFVCQEAKRLGISIWISGKALEVFANYNCTANIGGLKNDVLLCCAKSYLEYSSGLAACLKIEAKNIPERIFSLVKHHTILDEKINKLFRDGVLLETDHVLSEEKEEQSQGFHIDFYKYIDRKIMHYRQQGLADDVLAEKVGYDLEKYFSSVAQILRKDEASQMPTSIIEEAVWKLAGELLGKAAEEMGKTYGRNTLMAFAWHMQQFKERFAAGRTIFNPNLAHIKERYQKEFAFISSQQEYMEKCLGTIIPEDEKGFMTVFLVHEIEEYVKSHVGLVLVAHGRGIAQNMAEVTNNLLGTDRIYFYDIPLNSSNMQTIENLCEVIKKADEGLGVVLLVDMGFLMTMEDTLCKESGVQVRIVPNVTTSLVLEAGQHLFTVVEDLDTSVKAIYAAYDDYVMTTRQHYRSDVYLTPKEKKQKNVLLLCATGQGVAQKIKEILLAEIPEMKDVHFIMAGAVDNIQEIMKSPASSVDFIVGSVDPNIGNIPFVPVSELFMESGFTRIRELLQKKKNNEDFEDISTRKYADTYKLLATQIDKFVKTLPKQKVAACCMNVVDQISEMFFRGELGEDGVVRTYLHAACMFDRVYLGEALIEPQWGKKIQQERAMDFKCLQKILSVSSAKLFLDIPVGEICYFLSSLPVLLTREESKNED